MISTRIPDGMIGLWSARLEISDLCQRAWDASNVVVMVSASGVTVFPLGLPEDNIHFNNEPGYGALQQTIDYCRAEVLLNDLWGDPDAYLASSLSKWED